MKTCWRSECRTGCYYPDACSEVDNRLRHTSDEGLLKTFAVLTHRLHAADRGHTAAAPLLREQRRLVQVEILERMARGAERAHTTHVPAPCRAIPEEGL